MEIARCDVDGIDGFILGPRDLALSMGFMDGPAHPEVKAIIDEAIKIVTSKGKFFGTVAATTEQTKELTDKGFTVSYVTVRQMLKTLGFSLQVNKKTEEGGKDPDRNQQFEFINKKSISFKIIF